jgi:hypothetical protein
MTEKDKGQQRKRPHKKAKRDPQQQQGDRQEGPKSKPAPKDHSVSSSRSSRLGGLALPAFERNKHEDTLAAILTSERGCGDDGDDDQGLFWADQANQLLMSPKPKSYDRSWPLYFTEGMSLIPSINETIKKKCLF